MVTILAGLGGKIGAALMSLVGIGAILGISKLVLPKFIAGKLLKAIELTLEKSDEPSKALVKAIAKWAEAEIPDGGTDLMVKSSLLADKIISCSPKLLGDRKDSLTELVSKILTAADEVLKKESQ